MANTVLPERLKPLFDRVNTKFTEADNFHRPLRDRWDTFNAQWHSYNEVRESYRAARNEPGRDGVLREARSVFGDALFIPHTFATLENQLPRIVSNRPRGLIFPRDSASEANVESMRATVEAQQHRIGIDLVAQSVARSGLEYGLGVLKTGWRKRERQMPRLKPSMDQAAHGEWSISDPESRTKWDDPYHEQVSIYDWLWDPYGENVEGCTYIVHRAWRSTEYVLDKLGFNADGTEGPRREGGKQPWPLMPELTPEDVKSSTAAEWYSQVWAGRLRNRGYPGAKPKGVVHEIWEFHAPGEVVVVLDRQWPVARITDPLMLPWHGEFPFAAYRPTEVLNSMVGMGEVEPGMELQAELNALRTDRRWNALLKLHQVWAFRDGAITSGDIEFAPGALIPVENANPNEVLFPLSVGDIPNSGYQEESALKADWEMVTGLSDQNTGLDVGGNQTATGVQLSLAQANVRLQLKTHRLEQQVIRPATVQQILLNQQHVIANREYRMPSLPEPDAPDRMWTWLKVGPAELAGEFEYEVEGGSMSPENTPQRRADAQALFTLASNPLLNNKAILMEALHRMGMTNAQLYMAPEQPAIPASVPERLKEALRTQGMDPSIVDAVVAATQREAQNGA